MLSAFRKSVGPISPNTRNYLHKGHAQCRGWWGLGCYQVSIDFPSFITSKNIPFFSTLHIVIIWFNFLNKIYVFWIFQIEFNVSTGFVAGVLDWLFVSTLFWFILLVSTTQELKFKLVVLLMTKNHNSETAFVYILLKINLFIKWNNLNKI